MAGGTIRGRTTLHGLPRLATAAVAAQAIVMVARLVTAVRGIWYGAGLSGVQRVYFANHASHGDFILIWTVLPKRLRRRTRPVAGADYWLKTKARAFIGRDVFRAVLIERDPGRRLEDPVQQMARALDERSSLILFPEGTRNTGDEPLLPFRTGLYHLARARPGIEMVPVWIANLNRVMPKGEFLPIPLICTVTFGAPIHVGEAEEKDAFLTRARDALLALAPNGRRP